ncbi:MAG: HAMP domain-containing sensor histidine kinase [Acutalibacteraceae bacterium]|nr:HAMP domain-containing sensor histidine kinase [Acutalibacteraceae bacterium]
MEYEERKRFKLFPNVRVQVFVQFILIFFLIISVILFSSSSFYTSMIESSKMFEMRDAGQQLLEIDLYANDAIDKISDIATEHDILVEIYEKNNDTGKYTNNIYAKCYREVMFSDSDEYKNKENFNPAVDFSSSEFELLNEYEDKTYVGISTNTTAKKTFFVLVTPDSSGKHIFVTAVEYSLIDAMANSISLAAIIITTVIFIAVSIAVYFYITRITRPLNDIIYGTKIMAEGNDKSIRIPVRDNLLRTETEDAILNINTLYESLMLTQERLLEKSEFLATQLMEKDIEQKSRAKFIADTSHELKTPIAIIQGYAEGIKYVIDDKVAANEYCDTIIEECARMTDLVVNMMSLSNIQHTDELNYSDFNINEFIYERLKLHHKIFEKDGITAENKIVDNLYGHADVSKLQFVINNLISNAVSYIGGEDKKIIIRFEDLGPCYRIYVFNTGDPLPQESLQKLWDSFYRQDAARLRSEGHFGLGLSIVKATQDAHSQQCGVDNAEGGVEFWFDIAKGNPPEETE